MKEPLPEAGALEERVTQALQEAPPEQLLGGGGEWCRGMEEEVRTGMETSS